MPLFAETEAKIFGDVLYDIVNNTNITRASPGSKTRAVAQALSKKLGRMWRQFDLNMVQAYLTGAEGAYLDLMGSMLGVQRLGEVAATTSAAERIVKFYVGVGTFGSINGGSSIYLPKGAVVSTEAAAQGVRFVLSYAIILPADANSQYVSVQAVLTGSDSNVGSNQLNYHNFTAYTDILNNSLKVTNTAEIVTGSEIESDTNYRFRIANQINASEAANQTSVRLAALVVPGVSDVVLIPYLRGVGSFDLLLKATSPSVSSGLISTVQEAVGKVTAFGVPFTVRGPSEVGFSMIATLTLRTVLSDTEQKNIATAVTQNVTNYIDNLDISEPLIVNEIVQRVMETSDQIKNVGSANRPIDNAWIYVPSLLEDNKVRNTLLGDYQPDVDAKLLVETKYGGPRPIFIQVAQ